MSQSKDLHDPFVLLQRVHRWRMAFFCVVILLAGCVIGASGMFMWNHHKNVKKPSRPTSTKTTGQPPKATPKPNPNNAPWLPLSNRLKRRLSLTDEQYKKILPVMRHHWTQLNKIKMEARPKIREQLGSMNEKVVNLLNDKQKGKWRQDFRQLQQQFQLDYRPQTPPTPAAKKPASTPASKKPTTAPKKGTSTVKPPTSNQRKPGQPATNKKSTTKSKTDDNSKTPAAKPKPSTPKKKPATTPKPVSSATKKPAPKKKPADTP